jgi:hypothetical protein
MSATESRIVLDDATTLMQRLRAADPNPHAVERFYPLLTIHAGKPVVPAGVTVMLTLAISDYTKDMPKLMEHAMYTNIRLYSQALVGDNPEFMAEVDAFLDACGGF